ncbi:hypothetical protein IF2G_06446 [Cordyceps javanica]|nr:hypothetical protein IF2G_06446 [Cordyceps javanica]
MRPAPCRGRGCPSMRTEFADFMMPVLCRCLSAYSGSGSALASEVYTVLSILGTAKGGLSSQQRIDTLFLFFLFCNGGTAQWLPVWLASKTELPAT